MIIKKQYSRRVEVAKDFFFNINTLRQVIVILFGM